MTAATLAAPLLLSCTALYLFHRHTVVATN